MKFITKVFLFAIFVSTSALAAQKDRYPVLAKYLVDVRAGENVAPLDDALTKNFQVAGGEGNYYRAVAVLWNRQNVILASAMPDFYGESVFPPGKRGVVFRGSVELEVGYVLTGHNVQQINRFGGITSPAARELADIWFHDLSRDIEKASAAVRADGKLLKSVSNSFNYAELTEPQTDKMSIVITNKFALAADATDVELAKLFAEVEKAIKH